MNNLDISVIMPVYNSSKYLYDSIDSVLNQTFKNFELILVNDGSSDNSFQICNEYAEKDSRIKLFSQENKGAAIARANGLNKSRGKYIFFLDSDDRLSNDALSVLYNEIDEDTDIVVGSMDKKCNNEIMYIDIDEYRRLCLTGKDPLVPVSLCAKLYNRSLFDCVEMNIPKYIKFGEDMLVTIQIAFAATNKIKIISKQVYHYDDNIDSVSHLYNRTIELEYEFHKLYSNFIPEDKQDDYIMESIYCRINGLFSIPSLYKIPNEYFLYYKNIVDDVKKYNYKLNILDKLILNTYSPVFRYILINVKNVLLYLYRYFYLNRKRND